MIDIKKLSEEEKTDLIFKYSYFFSDSESFVEENLENYMEMEQILENIVKNIKGMEKEYIIHYIPNECCLALENKKTKDHYSIRIEF